MKSKKFSDRYAQSETASDRNVSSFAIFSKPWQAPPGLSQLYFPRERSTTLALAKKNRSRSFSFFLFFLLGYFFFESAVKKEKEELIVLKKSLIDYCSQSMALSPHMVGSEFSRLVSAATGFLDELRDFPPHGKLWESHFQRTFEHFMRVCFILFSIFFSDS